MLNHRTMDSLDDDTMTGASRGSLMENDVISMNRKIKLNLAGNAVCFKLEDTNSHNNSSNHHSHHHNSLDLNNNGKYCVQYVISYHSDGPPYSSRKSDIQPLSSKLDVTCESDKRGFISLPVNLNELDESSPLSETKSHHHNYISSSNSNQRPLMSPTDFLTLSEEASSAVKKDVNLSASRLESIIKKKNDSELNVCLDRYCESPFLMETPREVPMISDDDASNNGRASRLSESHEEIPGVDLFSSTLADQHNSIMEVTVTPMESENSRATPTLNIRDASQISQELKDIKEDKYDEHEVVIEEHDVEENSVDGLNFIENDDRDEKSIELSQVENHIDDEEEIDEEEEEEEEVDIKPDLALLNPLPHNSIPITSSSDAPPLASSSDIITTTQLTRSSLVGESIVIPSSTNLITLPNDSSSAVNHHNTSISINSVCNNVNAISEPVAVNGIIGSSSAHSLSISTPNGTSATTSSLTTTGSMVTLPVAPLDIKILPTGLLQLAANLASVFPSSTIHKQIALQLLREDGTSIIVPIATRDHDSNSLHISTAINEQRDQTNAPNVVSGNLPSQETNSSTTTTTTTVMTSINCVNGSPATTTVESVQNSDAERPFKCELCNSKFTRLGNYTRHKKIHSLPSKEDQRFRCDICGKSFIQRCDLARHLHIHRGTEPHRCSQCGKGYIRHSDLVTHQRFHNKEKPFACPHCSKGFCQRGDLNRHLRSIHLQLKPILCSHCHKKFAKEETLLRHINANHRDVVN
ncbi:uncharacterized protein LOC141850560 [Brevipalpus obovatus]|uniref:uncharacterized protein LOC141850560 n=1 Tax=Brevipalpus obovatus TaxID=246614 RepID=UPI003D9E0569